MERDRSRAVAWTDFVRPFCISYDACKINISVICVGLPRLLRCALSLYPLGLQLRRFSIKSSNLLARES